MNDLNQLKKLIKLLFLIFFSSIFLFLIKGLFAFMESDMSYIGDSLKNNSFSLLVFAIFLIKVISKIIFFIGGYYLIQILNFKELKDVFTSKTIAFFKKSAKFFIISVFIGLIAVILINIKDGFANLKTNLDFLYSLYFTAIIGLFLHIFSLVLEKAKELKQENDLTI